MYRSRWNLRSYTGNTKIPESYRKTEEEEEEERGREWEFDDSILMTSFTSSPLQKSSSPSGRLSSKEKDRKTNRLGDKKTKRQKDKHLSK